MRGSVRGRLERVPALGGGRGVCGGEGDVPFALGLAGAGAGAGAGMDMGRGARRKRGRAKGNRDAAGALEGLGAALGEASGGERAELGSALDRWAEYAGTS